MGGEAELEGREWWWWGGHLHRGNWVWGTTFRRRRRTKGVRLPRPLRHPRTAMRSKAHHCTHWRPPRGPTISSSQAARCPVTHLEAASRRGPRHLAALLSPQLSTLSSDRTQHPAQRVPASYPFKKPDRPGVGVVSVSETGGVA